MGVRFLNKFLKQHGWKGIHSLRVSDIKGKTLVIDTSIYLYRFKALEALVPNMLSLIQMFKKYDVRPIFIFDGSPKSNKKEVLQLRQKDKQLAWKIYSETPGLTNAYATQLRKRFTKVSKQDVLTIKDLLQEHGMPFMDAPHEADELCVKMVKTGKAYACVSDDMDMFLYGCPLVFRDVMMDKETFTSYNLSTMLAQLQLSMDEFKQICVLSGTDYYVSSYNLFDCLNMFSMFKKSSSHDFYEWMTFHHGVDYHKLMTAYQFYSIESPAFDYLLPFTQ